MIGRLQPGQVRQVNPGSQLTRPSLSVCPEVGETVVGDRLINMILHAACAQERFPLMFDSLYKCLLGCEPTSGDPGHAPAVTLHNTLWCLGSQDGGQNVSGCL